MTKLLTVGSIGGTETQIAQVTENSTVYGMMICPVTSSSEIIIVDVYLKRSGSTDIIYLLKDTTIYLGNSLAVFGDTKLALEEGDGLFAKTTTVGGTMDVALSLQSFGV